MHNIFYDNCRFHKRWQAANLDEQAQNLATDSVESLFIKKQAANNLHAAIGLLPLEQREVIILVDLQGYSYQDIADITAVPVGTVMSRLSRGRAKLKKLLNDEKKPAKYTNNIIKMKTGPF